MAFYSNKVLISSNFQTKRYKAEASGSYFKIPHELLEAMIRDKDYFEYRYVTEKGNTIVAQRTPEGYQFFMNPED